MGLTVIAVIGIVFTLAEQRRDLHLALGRLEGAALFLFVTIIVFSLYVVFSHRHHRFVQLAMQDLERDADWSNSTEFTSCVMERRCNALFEPGER